MDMNEFAMFTAQQDMDTATRAHQEFLDRQHREELERVRRERADERRRFGRCILLVTGAALFGLAVRRLLES